MKRIVGDIAALALMGILVFAGYHLLVGVSEAGSWFTFIHFQGGRSLGQEIVYLHTRITPMF